MKRAALYARISTSEARQTPEAQLLPLRDYAERREWKTVEYVDEISGAIAKRPALDELLASARRRAVDVVVVVKLDRLARSVRHLVELAGELQVLGVDLVVLDQAIDTTTSTGRLLFHVLAAIAEFERDLIRERVLAGVRRAQAHGTRSGRAIGRPRKHHVDQAQVLAAYQRGEGIRAIARRLGVPPGTIHAAVRKPA
jgi:DNA invertase Pin-like site-specific DNA recombinase